MLRELVSSANVFQQMSLGGLADFARSQLFVKSGWEVPDDTDSGISFGAGVEVGGGYMEMDLRDSRLPSFPQNYEAKGIYAEIGIGFGEISKAQKLIDMIVAKLPRKARPSSDFVVMPGGSITQFILGPKQVRSGLRPEDFKGASYVYIYGGGEISVAAADLGLMFMVDQRGYPQLISGIQSKSIFMALQGLLATCIAWAPYYGTSMGLGAGGKIAIRGIQTVTLSPV